MKDFQKLLSEHLQRIFLIWLDVHQIKVSNYEDNVHSVTEEINQLVKQELDKTVKEYQKFSLNNPTVKIKTFLDAMYGIDTFNERWSKQLNI